jgi:hypothetical protein
VAGRHKIPLTFCSANLEVDEKISRSVNTAVSVSLLFHPVYGFFFLTLKKNLEKNPQKERTYEVDEKSQNCSFCC